MNYANSPKNFISSTNLSRSIKGNAILIVCPRFRTVVLKSTKKIRAHEEILASYQSE